MFTLLFFFGNSLYVLSYAVRSIVWLRILSIIAGCFAIPYFLFRDTSDWSAIFWQSLYISVNIVNLVDLYRKSKPLRLSPEEQALQTGVFQDLSSRQIRALVDVGEWQTLKEGQLLTRLDEPVKTLHLVTGGHADVSIGGKSVMAIQGNDFIGEMSFLTGDAASADVRVGRGLRCLCWDHGELKRFLAKTPDTDSLFQGVLSKNVVQKLKLHASEKAARP